MMRNKTLEMYHISHITGSGQITRVKQRRFRIYLDGRPRGNTRCCRLLIYAFYYIFLFAAVERQRPPLISLPNIRYFPYLSRTDILLYR